jgi:hypothetical protein
MWVRRIDVRRGGAQMSMEAEVDGCLRTSQRANAKILENSQKRSSSVAARYLRGRSS